jgi:hypothetical protein
MGYTHYMFRCLTYSTFKVSEVHQFHKVVLKLEVQSVTVPHKHRICCKYMSLIYQQSNNNPENPDSDILMFIIYHHECNKNWMQYQKR